jgi:bifunctional enzyme CysN/CysC
MVPGVLSQIRYKVDVNTMKRDKNDDEQVGALDLNEIARCHMTLHRPIAFDSYNRNQDTGAFIIVDRLSNVTVAAGMILDRIVSKPSVDKAPVSQHIVKSDSLVSPEMRSQLLKQKGSTIWLTGLSGSGKSTVAKELERQLMEQGHLCYILDGDNVRHGLNRDLGFSMEDRKENIRRIAEVAALMNEAGLIVITSFISPYLSDRSDARDVIGAERMVEVFVDTPLEVCEQRDPKGLYKKARSGEIAQFTGISDPYEPPVNPEITISTEQIAPAVAAEQICAALKERSILD